MSDFFKFKFEVEMRTESKREKMQPTWAQMLERLKRAAGSCMSELAFCDAYLKYAPQLPDEDPEPALVSLSAIFRTVEGSLIVGIAALLEQSSDAISIPNLYKKIEDKLRVADPADLRGEKRVALMVQWKQRFDEFASSVRTARFIVVRDEIYSHNLVDSRNRINFEASQKMSGISSGYYGVTHGQVLDVCRTSLELLFDLFYLAGWGDAEDGKSDYAGRYKCPYEAHTVLLKTVLSHRSEPL